MIISTLKTVIFISTLIFIYSSSGQTFKTDKYKGRGLDIAAFERELLCFFSDGTGKLRKCVISSLLRQLRQLRRTLASLESFRFYGRYAHTRGISIPLGEVRNVEIERVTQRDNRISGKMRFQQFSTQEGVLWFKMILLIILNEFPKKTQCFSSQNHQDLGPRLNYKQSIIT